MEPVATFPEIVVLQNASQCSPFLGMTYPSFSARLSNLERETALLALGAWKGLPAGLALAEIKPYSAEVLSLFVGALFRRQGIAGALLARLEHELSQRGVGRLSLTYPSGKPTTAALERLLQKNGWEEPRPQMMLITISNWTEEQLFAPAWMRKTSLPPDYTIFPWSELTAEERALLLSLQGQPDGFPDRLSPFNEEHLIESATSLGCRYRNEIAGWLITHRIAPDTLRYTSLFVRPDLPFKGMGVRLLAKAFACHFQLMPSNSYACFGMFMDTPLVEFVRRRLVQLFPDMKITQTMTSSKVLAQCT